MKQANQISWKINLGKFRMRDFKPWVLLLFVCLAINLQAQNRVITGTVTDQSGEPLIGATVKVAGSQIGIATDVDGHFTLNAPQNGTLQISYIGYSPMNVKLTGESKYTIKLHEDASVLDDVVVVGYGTQKKATLT